MTIIEQLEGATEGSRELDATIAEALGIRVVRDGDEFYDWPPRRTEGADPGPNGLVADYTTSIDAALTLVPEGWHGTVAIPYPQIDITMLQKVTKDGRTLRAESRAATPALALCIAALRAREAS